MLDGYRARVAERPLDWGDEIPGLDQGLLYARWLGNMAMFAVFAGRMDDWPAAVRQVLGERRPAGLIVAELRPGDRVELRPGPLPRVLPGGSADAAVLLDSRRDDDTTIEVDGRQVTVPAGGVELVPLAGEPREVAVGPHRVPIAETTPAARVRIRSSRTSRWSVVDDRGGAWFPDGCLPRFDLRNRPTAYGRELEVQVPAAPITVGCNRGIEYEPVSATVSPGPGATAEVELEPVHLYDPAARGWYGGDLHVHMNYTGDQVATPADAARMQLGEGLHLMNLVAANIGTALVYDREAFESTAGTDLPWSGSGSGNGSEGDAVARFGVEFRNDLLGHVTALGPTGAPSRYATGHPDGDHPVDWPPNAAACRELHDLGATVTATHPVMGRLTDGTAAGAFAAARSMSARELVADAPLGLVDSVDLLGPSDAAGSALLYRHLLNCGLRLAATVGTDIWLSYSRGPLLANPPGYARMYADLRGAPLSVAAYQDAIRAGRTLATNGPWLELSVDRRPPGDVIEAADGDTLAVTVRVEGNGADRVELVGPDGVITSSDGDIDTTVTVDGSLWLCAVATGPPTRECLGPSVFAHTSPVHVEVAGRPVVRAASAEWLLDWLDRLEALLRSDGRFDNDDQRDELLTVVEQGRAYYRGLLPGRSGSSLGGGAT
jgi:hypothetical protein